jgi:hypothetical protein
MNDVHYSEFLRQMDKISLHDFFLDAFGSIKDLVTVPFFSNDWSDMLLPQNSQASHGKNWISLFLFFSRIFVQATDQVVSRLIEDLPHFTEQVMTEIPSRISWILWRFRQHNCANCTSNVLFNLLFNHVFNSNHLRAINANEVFLDTKIFALKHRTMSKPCSFVYVRFRKENQSPLHFVVCLIYR